MNADGTGLRRLTNRIGRGIGPPAWSPDGRALTFVRIDYKPDGSADTRTDFHLCVIGRDGSGGRRLPIGHVASYPSWSPDGSRIAIVEAHDFDPAWDLDTIPSNGRGTETVLISDGGNPNRPSWSQQGALAFNYSKGNLQELQVVDAGGRHRIDGAEHNYAVSWSPSGSMLAYLTLGSGWAVIGADGTGRHVLTGVNAWGPVPMAWSPDSTAIAYAEHTGDHDDVMVVPVDGGAPRTVTDHGREADWSSANRITFFSESDPGVGVVSPDGTGRRTIVPVPSGLYVIQPRWSPDGSQIAFVVDGSTGPPSTAAPTSSIC